MCWFFFDHNLKYKLLSQAMKSVPYQGGALSGSSSDFLPVVTEMMIIISTTNATTPRMSHILQFFHQYFRFNLAACVSNWLRFLCQVNKKLYTAYLAPCWRASARSSNCDNFWSRSKTFSTLPRMIPTTSWTFFYSWLLFTKIMYYLGLGLL